LLSYVVGLSCSLVWVDRKGHAPPVPTLPPRRQYVGPRIFPDNLLKGDSLTQRAWQSVRHIERYSAPRSKSAGATEKPETTADNPPKPAADIVPVN